MEKILKIIFAASVFLFLTALAFIFALRIPEKTSLNGVFETASYPSENQSVWNGQFQAQYAKWFNDNFGKHNFILKVYNQIKYLLFNEGNARWIIGSDKYLFDVGQAKRNFSSGNTDEEFENYAVLIADFQKKMISMGKKTLFVLTPCKAEIYPEKLPWNYKSLTQRYKDSEEITRFKLISAFDKNNVIYYDATQDVMDIKNANEYPAFYNTAHHWSFMAAANITKKMLELTGDKFANFEVPQINVVNSSGEEFRMDKDAYLLLNVFRGKKADSYDSPFISYGKPSEEKVYIYGSSFSGEIFYTIAKTADELCVKEITYQTYNTIRSHREKSVDDTKYFKEGEAFQYFMDDCMNCTFLIMEQQVAGGVMGPHEEFIEYLMKELNKNTDK